MKFRTYLLLFVLLAALYITPIFLVAHPPATDLPVHLALATVLFTRGADHDPYADLFRLPQRPTPNTLYYYGVAALGHVMPLDVANRIFLSLAVLLTPISIALAQRARRADMGVSLLGFALATSFNLIFGFIGFVLGIPFVVASTALARWQTQKPSWSRALLLLIALEITFFAHAQLMLFAVGLLGLIAICAAERGRRLLALFATLGPGILALVPAAPWYLTVLRRSKRAGGLAPEWYSLSRNLRDLPSHTFDFLNGASDIIIGGSIAAVLLAMIFLRPRRLDEPLRRRRVFDILAIASAISYFALPANIRDQCIINGRHAVLALVFLAAAVDVDTLRRSARWLLRAGILLTFAFGLLFADATLRVGRETGDLKSLFAKLGPGARLFYAQQPRSAVFRFPIYRGVYCYIVPWNLGITDTGLASIAMHPIRSTSALELPDPGKDPDWNHDLAFYDGVLSNAPLTSPRLRLIGESGLFRMYRVAR